MGMITKDDRELINKLYDKFNKGERRIAARIPEIKYSQELVSKATRVCNTQQA